MKNLNINYVKRIILYKDLLEKLNNMHKCVFIVLITVRVIIIKHICS